MERNGSGVSALLGLDGFVVLAQLLDEVEAESSASSWGSPQPYRLSAMKGGGVFVDG